MSGELSSFHSFISGEDTCIAGANCISYSESAYFLVGGSFSVGFNYKHFANKRNMVI